MAPPYPTRLQVSNSAWRGRDGTVADSGLSAWGNVNWVVLRIGADGGTALLKKSSQD